MVHFLAKTGFIFSVTICRMAPLLGVKLRYIELSIYFLLGPKSRLLEALPLSPLYLAIS
jgi:hypothetical protein